MPSELLLPVAMCLLQVPLTAGADETSRKPNTLSVREAAEGWLLLFDGESVFGWKELASRWKASDGSLSCSGSGQGCIRTTTEFGDFVLRFRFRHPAGAKGAVRFRAKATDNAGSNGYELRLDDRDPKRPTGSIVGLTASDSSQGSSSAADNAWREVELLAEGQHLRVSLDGNMTVDTRDAGHSRGVVAITSEAGAAIEFRDVRLKPLSLTSVFNGKDLSGWWLKPNTPCRAEVRDGALQLISGKGQIETEGRWKDFVLQLEIRTGVRHTNSGVFFRGEPHQRWHGYEAQILNKWQGDDRGKPEDFGTGAIYNRQAARRIYADDMQWFTMTVIAHGNHMATWVNGCQAADFTDARPPNANGRYGQKTSAGVICLQGHDPDGSISFRNIRVVELPAP